MVNLRYSSFVRRYQVLLFFVLAYALSWLVWGSSIAQQRDVLGFHIPGTFAFISVSAAAFMVAALASGWSGVKDLLLRIVRWRVRPIWYAGAILVPVALAFIPAGIYRLFGGAVPVGAEVPLGAAAVYFVYGTGLWLVTEETAWRGFALPRLQAGRSALSASLILGLLWGVWHTPLFFDPEAAQSGFPYVGFVVFTVAESVLIAWVYNSTGGSVLLAALFHAAADASLSFSGVLFGSHLLFWITVGVSCIAAVIVVLVAGPAHLSRNRGAEQSTVLPPGYAVESKVRVR